MSLLEIIYYAVLPEDVDEKRAILLAKKRARVKGLVPTGPVEIVTQSVGRIEYRVAEVVCRKFDVSLHPDVMFAPLCRGLKKRRRQIKRKTGRVVEGEGVGPQG